MAGRERLATLLKDVAVASIGLITSDTAREYGLQDHIQLPARIQFPHWWEAIRDYL